MRTQIQVVLAAGIATVVCTLVGCSSPILSVRKDPGAFPNTPIPVHILGVSAIEKERELLNKPQSYWAYQYWIDYLKSDFPVPQDARHDQA